MGKTLYPWNLGPCLCIGPMGTPGCDQLVSRVLHGSLLAYELQHSRWVCTTLWDKGSMRQPGPALGVLIPLRNWRGIGVHGHLRAPPQRVHRRAASTGACTAGSAPPAPTQSELGLDRADRGDRGTRGAGSELTLCPCSMRATVQRAGTGAGPPPQKGSTHPPLRRNVNLVRIMYE